MRLSSALLVLLALIIGALVNAIIIPADPAAGCSVKILEAFAKEETIIQLVESVKQVPKNARRYSTQRTSPFADDDGNITNCHASSVSTAIPRICRGCRTW
jgi:hypothetical protein